jgi:ribosomal protein S27AE
MKNRNKKKNMHPIPRHCPKCGGNVLPDTSKYGARFHHGWFCMKCGMTDDDQGYYDAIKKRTVYLDHIR